MNSQITFKKGHQPPAFCIITPTSYLVDYAVRSTTHLTLAHLVDTDEEYTKFYSGRAERGDRIIMDCSAFELGESYAPDKLIELGERCGAHAIVLPDYPFLNSQKTVEAAIELAPKVKAAGFSTFFVPQSKINDLEDWINCYMWASTNPDIDIIGYSILGIPNALPHIPPTYARVVMAHILKERGLLKHHKHNHFLGLNASPNVELPSLIKMGVLDSCDSSNPVWCGVNGIKYNDTFSDWMGIQKKYLREVNFDEPFSKKDHIHKCIQHNLNLTLELFK